MTSERAWCPLSLYTHPYHPPCLAPSLPHKYLNKEQSDVLQISYSNLPKWFASIQDPWKHLDTWTSVWMLEFPFKAMEKQVPTEQKDPHIRVTLALGYSQRGCSASYPSSLELGTDGQGRCSCLVKEGWEKLSPKHLMLLKACSCGSDSWISSP